MGSWTEYYTEKGKLTVRPGYEGGKGYIIGDYLRVADGTYHLMDEIWTGGQEDLRDVLSRFFNIHYNLMGD